MNQREEKRTRYGAFQMSLKCPGLTEKEVEEESPRDPKVMMKGSMELEDERRGSGAVHTWVGVQASTLGSRAP